VRARGVLLPGTDASLDVPLEPSTNVTASSFLASKLVLVATLQKLEVGQSIETSEAELSLGSKLDLPVKSWTITRIADVGGTRRFELVHDKKQPQLLALDERGWPISYEIDSFGAKVRFERQAP
jgi:hypothetical protein